MDDKEGNVMVGKGVTINGSIKLSGAIYIFGEVNGELEAQELHVGESGKVTGEIKTDIADIRGEVNNTLEVTKTLVIRDTGKVTGKVRYESIEIENGGFIDGQIEKIAVKKTPIAPSTVLTSNESSLPAE